MLIWLGPTPLVSRTLSPVGILLLHRSVERVEAHEFDRQSLQLPPALLPARLAVDGDVVLEKYKEFTLKKKRCRTER